MCMGNNVNKKYKTTMSFNFLNNCNIVKIYIIVIVSPKSIIVDLNKFSNIRLSCNNYIQIHILMYSRTFYEANIMYSLNLLPSIESLIDKSIILDNHIFCITFVCIVM